MLNGKTVLVTGGSEGIGAAISKAIISERGKVINFDMQKPKYEIEQNLKTYNIDLNNLGELENLCNEILNSKIEIHGIVNNAGFFNGDGFSASLEDWYKALNINILSNFIICKIFKNQNALESIVNIASISGVIAQQNYLVYNTMKGALINMTKCMALDLSDQNVRVNSVSPATVWTEKNEYYIRKSHGIDVNEANIHKDFGGQTMMKRVASPDEVAKPVLFLLSENASYVNAENIFVDGGKTAL